MVDGDYKINEQHLIYVESRNIFYMLLTGGEIFTIKVFPKLIGG